LSSQLCTLLHLSDKGKTRQGGAPLLVLRITSEGGSAGRRRGAQGEQAREAKRGKRTRPRGNEGTQDARIGRAGGEGECGGHTWASQSQLNAGKRISVPRLSVFFLFPVGELLTGFAMRSDPNVVSGD